jgi:hypothetical protein
LRHGSRVILLFCLILSSCEALRLSDSGTEPRTQTPPPDQKTAELLAAGIFPQTKLSGTPEVSALREARPPQSGDWMFCLKSSNADEQMRYALFLKGNTFLDYRAAVVIDGCYNTTYQPLGAATNR